MSDRYLVVYFRPSMYGVVRFTGDDEHVGRLVFQGSREECERYVESVSQVEPAGSTIS